MSSATDSYYKCSKITAAVEFLRDVSAKGYSERILKKYLLEKRGLTAEEVDVAWVINKNRKETQTREDKTKGHVKKGGKSDRPEIHTSFSSRKQVQDVGFLVPAKQPEGEKLINDFLDTENAYCSILQCLTIEYYDVLARCANRGRFDMSKKELDEIFARIPGLLKFHNDFFLDIKRGSHIGRMFVRLFKFFEGYAGYMKDCQKAVYKMRKFIRDTRLQGCLVHISKKSIRPNEDMVDLLLTPLERMLDYRDFLNKLYSWGDRTMTTDYELLGKAARRIGRVAAYIEKYSYGIYNQNEMNKVQKFLGDQCDILSPNRFIVRRGMMIRRSSGWTARNKRHVFFLFNDILLWTSKNGSLQSALQLRRCEVIPSSSKNNACRKFEVVYRGERQKSLKLECDKIHERNQWYESLLRTITAVKESSNQAWSRSESNAFAKYKEYFDELSDDESKEKGSKDTSKYDDDENRLEQSEQIDDPYNKRYTETSSFRIQEYKEIHPMDDNVSQISEQDVAFHEKHSGYLILPTSAQLSPFDGEGRRSSGNVFRVKGITRSNSNVRKKFQRNEAAVQRQEINESTFEFFEKRQQKSKVIRRVSRDIEARRKNSPQCTIRLDNI